jgi:hypothetical protein
MEKPSPKPPSAHARNLVAIGGEIDGVILFAQTFGNEPATRGSSSISNNRMVPF